MSACRYHVKDNMCTTLYKYQYKVVELPFSSRFLSLSPLFFFSPLFSLSLSLSLSLSPPPLTPPRLSCHLPKTNYSSLTIIKGCQYVLVKQCQLMISINPYGDITNRFTTPFNDNTTHRAQQRRGKGTCIDYTCNHHHIVG